MLGQPYPTVCMQQWLDHVARTKSVMLLDEKTRRVCERRINIYIYIYI